MRHQAADSSCGPAAGCGGRSPCTGDRFGTFPNLLCVQEEEEAAHAGIQAVDLKPTVHFTRNVNTAPKTTSTTPQGQTCQPERKNNISSLQLGKYINQ